MKVGILGATGPAGQALAARLASVGLDVVVGSRSVERATAACEGIAKKWPDLDLPLIPGTNDAAARADLGVVATPWDAAASTAASVKQLLAGKVVISMANALTKVGGELRPYFPPEGSVAVGVQRAIPASFVAAAFHHLPARSLGDLDRPATGDVLVCTDHPEALEATSDLIRRVPDLRPLNAGSLAAAAPEPAAARVAAG